MIKSTQSSLYLYAGKPKLKHPPSMMYQSFRAVLLGILVSRTVTGQGCDPSNPFGANCDSSPPAIAIDGQLHLCNMISINVLGLPSLSR